MLHKFCFAAGAKPKPVCCSLQLRDLTEGETGNFDPLKMFNHISLCKHKRIFTELCCHTVELLAYWADKIPATSIQSYVKLLLTNFYKSEKNSKSSNWWFFWSNEADRQQTALRVDPVGHVTCSARPDHAGTDNQDIVDWQQQQLRIS
jgi:hypothetical protein